MIQKRRVLFDDREVSAWFEDTDPTPRNSLGVPLDIKYIGLGTIKGHGSMEGTADLYAQGGSTIKVPVYRKVSQYRTIRNS